MTSTITLLTSAVVTFLAHHFGEKFFTRNWTKQIRLTIKGYQIHHSFWGAVAIVIATIFTSGTIMFALLGYGLGSIWQHKKTHNSLSEKGLVFITRVVRK
ncbi:MAG: hypothetical protein HY396_00540 [Candidatus Doudnabacteria bacterium]|nr:hypothetical protein [Candidatus Doudnabacteria bacterium]